MTEDEMVGWHHWFDGHEFEQALGAGNGREAWRTAVHGVAKSQTWLSDWTELKYVNATLPICPILLNFSRDSRETSKLPHIRIGEGEGLAFFQGWSITEDSHYHTFIKWRFPKRSLMIHLGQYNSLWGSSQEHFWFSSSIIWRDNDLSIIKHRPLLFWTYPLLHRYKMCSHP